MVLDQRENGGMIWIEMIWIGGTVSPFDMLCHIQIPCSGYGIADYLAYTVRQLFFAIFILCDIGSQRMEACYILRY